MSSSNPQSFRLWPLVLSSLLGSMAMMALNTVMGPMMRQLKLADWQTGAIMTFAGLLWMLTAAWWGRLSNRIGRKPVVVIGLLGLGVSLLFFAGLVQANVKGLQWSVLSLIICFSLARGGMSLFYGAVPVASQAKVADELAPAQRGPALAGMGAAQGMGMVLGPAICSFLANKGLAWPFWFAAGLPFLALLLTIWGMDNAKPAFQVGLAPRLKLSDPRIRLPLATAFACMFVVMAPTLTIGFLAIDTIKLSAQAGASAAGLSMTSVGIALLVAQLWVRKLNWPPRKLILIGAPWASLCFTFLPFVVQWFPSLWVLSIASFLAAFGIGFVWPSFQTATLNAVGSDEQGEAAGHISATQGAATVVSPIVMAGLYSVHFAAPYVLAGVILAWVSWMWWQVKIRF